ncbi:phage tail assembly protein [Hoeflea sp.]|uniref:phage tail assembly protein n=1 Tax=Hoeflea sp. TaxID=1940281 RepID=UPI003749F9C0
MTKKLMSVTVDLDFPVPHEGREISSLTFRRMKARDALAGEGIESEVRAGYAIFAALAGVDVAVIEDLDIEDLAKVGEEVAPLMGKRLAGMIEKAVPSPGES